MRPSQLSSRLLQTSAVGCFGVAAHEMVPAVHRAVPLLKQAPTPIEQVPSARTTPPSMSTGVPSGLKVTASSTMPSQSSSMLLHSSVETAAEQVDSVAVPPCTSQVWVPRPEQQASVMPGVEQPQPSFAMPLQFSSTIAASHSSVAAGLIAAPVLGVSLQSWPVTMGTLAVHCIARSPSPS